MLWVLLSGSSSMYAASGYFFRISVSASRTFFRSRQNNGTRENETRRKKPTPQSPSVSQSVIAQLDDARMSDEGTIEGGIEGGERTSTW